MKKWKGFLFPKAIKSKERCRTGKKREEERR